MLPFLVREVDLSLRYPAISTTGSGLVAAAIMRGDTLIQRHPPTPPTLVGDFHSGLHRVAQYNADRGYPYDESSYDLAGVVGHEGLPSRTSHGASHAGDGMGLGIRYVGTHS